MKVAILILIFAISITISCSQSGSTNNDPGPTEHSNFACVTNDDCTLSHYQNNPSSSSECKCAAIGCIEVVNITEEELRESNYVTYCPGTKVETGNCNGECEYNGIRDAVCSDGFCAPYYESY